MNRLVIIIWACSGLYTGAGAQWDTLGPGLDHGVRALLYDSAQQRLYAFGRFTSAGGMVVNGTAMWYEGQWHAMGNGVENAHGAPVISATRLGSDSILIGGFFSGAVGVDDTQRMALWDGAEWKSIGTGGANGLTWGMLTNEDGTTVVGTFQQIASLPMNRMARFQNDTWTNLCAYPTDQGFVSYTSVVQYQGQYIIGGNINVPGLREIGWLDGDTLRQLGPGILGDSWVNDLVEFQGLLYVGGEFYAGWGNAASGVMTWDGEQFADPFPSVQYVGMVHTMTVANGELFVSGRVMLPGSTDYYQLLRFDGERICLFGKNFNTTIRAIAASPEHLYFAPNVQWLAPNGTPLGWIASYDLSYQGDTCISIATSMPGPGPVPDHAKLLVYPNPTDGLCAIELATGTVAPVKPLIYIYDTAGRLLLDGQPMARDGEGVWRGSMQFKPGDTGLRFVRVRCVSSGLDLTSTLSVH